MHLTRRNLLKSLGFAAAGPAFVSLVPRRLSAETKILSELPRSTPEAQGISSTAVVEFLSALAKLPGERHSFMLLRHGNVIAEGWWKPYGPKFNHWLYSLSKSFTSTAVGLAAAAGKLSVDDLITKHFPGDLPEKVGENLAALRIKDLLCMTVGHASDPTWEMVKAQNWVRDFLARPVAHVPGSHFVYNSGATYLCSAIVQKVTGQTLLDFLTPRLFDPLRIEGAKWESCPLGINTGGWGLSVPTGALAKFGQLYLQKGKWQDRQLLPAKWVEEATSFKIQQPEPDKPSRPKERNDWLQGYCYQFWRSQHHAYRGDGAFGQFSVVLPDQDAVLVLTSETNDLQGELDSLWNILLPAFGDRPLAEDPAANGKLRERLAALELPPVAGKPNPNAAGHSGKKFVLSANGANLVSAEFNFLPSGATILLGDGKQEHSFPCGAGEWKLAETSLPGMPPRLVSGGAAKAGTKHKIAVSGAWQDERSFEVLCRFYETPHHEHIRCDFEGSSVKIAFTSSLSRLGGKPEDHHLLLAGRIQ